MKQYLFMLELAERIRKVARSFSLSILRESPAKLKSCKDENLIAELLEDFPFYISHIPNPSIFLQLTAVKKEGKSIKYIKSPSEEVQIAAVEQDPRSLSLIKNPSEEVCATSLRKDGTCIFYVTKPSEMLQLIAVRQNRKAFGYIPKPKEKVKAEYYSQNLIEEM